MQTAFEAQLQPIEIAYFNRASEINRFNRTSTVPGNF